jgi:hypothetical protein
MSIPSDLIERARAVPIAEVAAGLQLRRVGHEIVGACPRCGGRDRFAVRPDRGIWNCRGCGTGGDTIALAMHLHGVDFRGAVQVLTGEHSVSARRAPADRKHQAPAPSRQERDEAAYAREQARKAAWLWSRHQPVSDDTPPALYLRKRGYAGQIPATLGYLPESGEHPPAMIAAFGLAQELESGILGPSAVVTQVHITRLTTAGDKADVAPVKIILGTGSGAPIVLAPPNDLLGLAVTEGIEDGLSVAAATGLGVWAAGTANRMPPLVAAVPSYIECVTIFAHGDDAGRRHARELAAALATRMEVFVEGIDE